MQYFERAKKASLSLKVTDTQTKNKALLSISNALRENISEILKIPKSKISIVIGEKSSIKTIKVRKNRTLKPC